MAKHIMYLNLEISLLGDVNNRTLIDLLIKNCDKHSHFRQQVNMYSVTNSIVSMKNLKMTNKIWFPMWMTIWPDRLDIVWCWWGFFYSGGLKMPCRLTSWWFTMAISTIIDLLYSCNYDKNNLALNILLISFTKTWCSV